MVGSSVLYLTICIFGITPLARAEYPTCGTSTSNIAEVGLEDNIASHATRLIALRNSNYGWENTPEVVVAIQLGKPDSFQNMEETGQRLENELKANRTRVTLGQLAQYLLAAKATCKSLDRFAEMNLLNELQDKMEKEFTYDGIQHKTARHGWYGFYLALGAYCVAQKQSPSDIYLHRALHSQNTDGSFDHTHSLDHTAQAMLSLTCLSRLDTLGESLQTKISSSLNRASKFLKSKVVTERDNVWIGDKYASPVAALAINEHSQWTTDAWRCRLIMRSLNRAYENEEGESALAQRLMALHGKSILSLMDDGYECQTEDAGAATTPDSAQRTSFKCDSEDNEIPNFPFPPTLIDVQISVHPNAFAHDETRNLGTEVFTVNDVRKGKTLIEIMTIAQCRGLVSFATETTAWGEYVISINGVEADTENKEYLAIMNNGESLNVGIGQFEPSHADRIAFKLKRWH